MIQPPAVMLPLTLRLVQVTQEAAASHNLLPPNHPNVHLVKRVGMRIAGVSAGLLRCALSQLA